MTKPFIKQKRFFPRSSESGKRASFWRDGAFPVDFLNEVSCFETLRVYDGKIFCFQKHLARLRESCLGIGKECPFDKRVESWLKKAVRESSFPNALLRLSVHWRPSPHFVGAEAFRTYEVRKRVGEWVVMIREFESYPAELYEEGVALKTAVPRRWTLKAQDPQIKASQFVSGVLASLDCAGQKPHEFLFLNSTGTVAEGSVSNVFIVNGAKRILTPSVGSGILRGVTRELLIGLAKKRGFKILETPLTRHEIYSAKECFLTNTSSEVLPVVRVDDRSIGNGKPGPVTRWLASDFKKVVRKL